MRALAAAAAALLAVVALAGCGGSSSSSSNATEQKQQAAKQQAADARKAALYRTAIHDNYAPGKFTEAPWYGLIDGVEFSQGWATVKTSIYHDDEGKLTAGRMCNAIDVAYGAPEHNGVEVLASDGWMLAHCEPESPAPSA